MPLVAASPVANPKRPAKTMAAELISGVGRPTHSPPEGGMTKSASSDDASTSGSAGGATELVAAACGGASGGACSRNAGAEGDDDDTATCLGEGAARATATGEWKARELTIRIFFNLGVANASSPAGVGGLVEGGAALVVVPLAAAGLG